MKRINVDKLREWVKSLSYDDWHDNRVIKKAFSIKDVYLYQIMGVKSPPDKILINYGDSFIVDLEGHLCLAKWTRKKYIMPTTKRVVNIKIIEKLKRNNIDSVNGYWEVPSRFWEKK